MFSSLSSRILALAGLVIVSLCALAGLLIDASTQTSNGFRWVVHSAEVIEVTDRALIALRDAESGQRGFILTANPTFALSVEQRVADTRHEIDRVVALTSDSPRQNARARELRALMIERATILDHLLELGRQGNFKAAKDGIASGRGREVMTAITLRAANFLDEERTLQDTRIADADGRLAWVRLLALGGIIVISLLVLIVSATMIRGIRGPSRIIQAAMTALGRGDRDVRVVDVMGSSEFSGLAAGYNAMADRLAAAVANQTQSEDALQIAHDELQQSSLTLKDRGEVIELLGGMAHRMQAARTDDELAQVIRVFVPRVLPGVPGALFAHNNSRNLLVPIAGWGGMEPARDGFAPDQCWALRRGRSHFLARPGSDIVCGHVHDESLVYHCEPLLAGGEVIGTLYLEGVIDLENRFRLTVLAENIASALVNHSLQRGLREQTIRDPLTGLFNRRYMEETLAIEIARASRSGAPLSLVMCDIDHFKRFNDEFGHEAGDVVLQAVATMMRAKFRDGDVVCRYGGEEFTIIAPGATPEALHERVEIVRQAITEINLRLAGVTLGRASMSFGIACWENGMDREGLKLMQAADAALYQAKREGRNRTIVTLRQAA